MLEFYGLAPAHICALFTGNATGIVEMVNSRGIYLELSGVRVLLCDASQGVVPNGAALENWKRLPGSLRVGQTVTAEKGYLQTETCQVKLHLTSIPKDLRLCVPKKASIAWMQTLLKEKKTEKGLAPLLFGGNNPYCVLARPLVEGLVEALRTDDMAGICQCTQNLLGLGTGLTPSGDDVLSGLVYGLRHSAWRERPAVTAFLDSIRREAPLRTNGVSADYLCAVCADAPFEKLANAWADPVRYAGQLLTVGNNSGSEMLLGLTLAGSLILAC